MEREHELMKELTHLGELHGDTLPTGKILTTQDLEQADWLKDQGRTLNAELCRILSEKNGRDITHTGFEFW